MMGICWISARRCYPNDRTCDVTLIGRKSTHEMNKTCCAAVKKKHSQSVIVTMIAGTSHCMTGQIRVGPMFLDRRKAFRDLHFE